MTCHDGMCGGCERCIPGLDAAEAQERAEEAIWDHLDARLDVIAKELGCSRADLDEALLPLVEAAARKN